MPLLLLGLLCAVLATVEWRRLPLVARAYLGVATAFAIAAVAHPGMTVADALGGTHDGITLVLAAARAVGLAALMMSVATGLRRLVVR